MELRLTGRFMGKRIRKVLEVETLQQASEATRDWICEYELGGSGDFPNYFQDGLVYHGRTKVARISFNGRAWTPEQYPKKSQELSLDAVLAPKDAEANKGNALYVREVA